MNELKNYIICHHFGAEMHSDADTKWKFLGVNEDLIKSDTYYKVWLVLKESEDQSQSQPFTCEVYEIEEVPQEIIEAEKLVRKLLGSKRAQKVN